MLKQYNTTISKMIDNFHYSGALDILEDNDFVDGDMYNIIKSCMYAVNFDFKTAYLYLDQLSKEKKEIKEIKDLTSNVKKLIEGEPITIFSELLENIKFQLSSSEYIDYLGRIYRCKEAIFKYIFIEKHLNKGKFSFHLEVMSKRTILKILRKKYKIFNSNLVYAITTYINRYHGENKKYKEIVSTLNSEKMTNLIELRNQTIVGHGFIGVSREDISKIYGNPYNVIDDFKRCLELLDIEVIDNKYTNINKLIKKELEILASAENQK